MSLPQDIELYVLENFSSDQAEHVIEEVCRATQNCGPVPAPRIARCLLVGSKGSLQGLKELIVLLGRDYRDVIVRGEYESIDGELVRVRDLSQPFGPGAA